MRSAFVAGEPRSNLVLVAAHPASTFTQDTANLLAELSGTQVVCFNLEPGGSPDDQVAQLEAQRERLGVARWGFWGLSGGGWLGQRYAWRRPHVVTGLIVESACACFHARLGDPSCVLSPSFPAWRAKLDAKGWLDERTRPAPSGTEALEWHELDGVGPVLRLANGPAVLVSPSPVDDVMRRELPRWWAFDARAWLGEIAVPTLVIAGANDTVAPVAHVQAVHDALDDVRWCLVPDGGHVPSTERRPESTAAVRAFVDELVG